MRLGWRNIYDPRGSSYQISATSIADRGGYALSPVMVAVKTYRDVIAAYRCNPEPKSLGLDGHPCRRHTVGALTRRPVHALSVTHIGKEANLLEEIAAGLITAEADTLNEYGLRAIHQPREMRHCEGCPATLVGKQHRWCPSCRADHRLRLRVTRRGLISATACDK